MAGERRQIRIGQRSAKTNHMTPINTKASVGIFASSTADSRTRYTGMEAITQNTASTAASCGVSRCKYALATERKKPQRVEVRDDVRKPELLLERTACGTPQLSNMQTRRSHTWDDERAAEHTDHQNPRNQKHEGQSSGTDSEAWRQKESDNRHKFVRFGHSETREELHG